MLNKNNERELAYLVKVEAITPMNADRLECAHIGGWHCVVGKGEFEVGDPAVYFEIDSQLPEVEPFTSMEFLKSKHYKIKTQKIRSEYSQGLLMPVSAFGWQVNLNNDGCFDPVSDHDTFCINDESRFLTKILGVTYAVAADNKRKSNTNKYSGMKARHPKLFRNKFIKWVMKHEWGRKIMFFFFGKKKDKKSDWPAWVVKTNEERCQNLPQLFPGDNTEWIATEKIDGTSTTFTIKGTGRKQQFFACSRNVVFNNPSKEERNYYKNTDGNVYLEMEQKYNMHEVMFNMFNYYKVLKDIDFLTIQGETYGGSIQKRNYGTQEHQLAIFNIIFGYKDGHTERLNPVEGAECAKTWGLPYVPVVDEHFKLPATCEELLELATGKSVIDGEMREGLVFRSYDGTCSFKAVSNEYLVKYHG